MMSGFFSVTRGGILLSGPAVMRKIRNSAGILALVALAACTGYSSENAGPDLAVSGEGASRQTARHTPLSGLPDEYLEQPATMVGLQRARLEQLVGKPDRIRREDPAEIWQFSGRNCVLDIFLYDRGQGATIAYIEERDRQGAVLDAGDCLRELAGEDGGAG